MKAVLIERFGGPEVLAYCDVPTPQPGPGDVVVEVRAATVNLTLDIHTRQDGDGRNPMLPLVLGSDPVGVIAAVGSGVDSRHIGEHVAVASTLACATCANCTAGRPDACTQPRHLGIHRWGGYADYVRVGASDVRAIPADLDFKSAAAIFRHFPAAYGLARKAGGCHDQTLLVMGASGALGAALVQIGKQRGSRVVAAAGSDAGVQAALELGADAGINYRRHDLEAEVMAATDARGVDVAFENSGDSKLWAAAFACLARNGTMVTAGAHGGDEVAVNIKRLYRLKLRILGGTANTEEDFVATCDAAVRNRLRIPIHCILPLSRVAEAHELVSSRTAVGKVVLVPDRAA
jgi:NADPH:quinone reductase-like Zn-dependent oxidoreductase